MSSIKQIGFAGTDGRTFISADVVSTATSQFSPDKFEGVVVRGMPAMIAWADMQKKPVRFVETGGNSVDDYERAITESFRQGKLDCVFPMPEGLLVGGLVDKLIEAGFGGRVVGLTKLGSLIEGDKIACKKICARAGIPVANEWKEVDARDYKTVLSTCLGYAMRFGGSVLKYPYMAAGKGSRVILNPWDIKTVYDNLINDYRVSYGEVCGKEDPWPLLIESRMGGFEISFTVFIDGVGHFQIMPTALDYPERFPGPSSDSNPITGGMGSISPHPLETKELFELAAKTIVKPLVNEMRQMGILRPCIVYPGCMVNFDANRRPTSLRVCEINIRPGEPEWQAVARRLRNLGALCAATVNGNLHEVAPEVRQNQLSMTLALVVGPAPGDYKGYPWRCIRGETMEIDTRYLKKNGITLVPSGMDWRDGQFIADGTRIAYLVGNATINENTSRQEVAALLRKKLVLAYAGNKVRIIPKENPAGNRLAIRDDVGAHFEIEARIFAN